VKNRERSPLAFYTIGIAALFLAGFFLLVVFGAQTYRNTVAGQTGNNQTRGLISYLSTCVKGGDTAGGVYVEETLYGQVLVIADGDSGYGLRIYQNEGNLLEDYAALDAPLAVDHAQVIGQTSVFEIQGDPSELLMVTTDAGKVLLHTRSGEGGDGR